MIPSSLFLKSIEYNFMVIKKYGSLGIGDFFEIRHVKRDYISYVEKLAKKYTPQIILEEYDHYNEEDKINNLLEENNQLIKTYLIFLIESDKNINNITKLLNRFRDYFHKNKRIIFKHISNYGADDMLQTEKCRRHLAVVFKFYY